MCDRQKRDVRYGLPADDESDEEPTGLVHSGSDGHLEQLQAVFPGEQPVRRGKAPLPAVPLRLEVVEACLSGE